MSSEIYLTREGYEKLRKKLGHMKNVRRRELSEAIGEAISHGDISENAEYNAAKDEQAVNERKIAELEDQLSRVRILEEENIASDKVLIGAVVELKDLDSGEELKYMLVSELEADYTVGKISITSPVGKGLIGHKVDDIVEINIPAGVLKYQVLKISRT